MSPDRDSPYAEGIGLGCLTEYEDRFAPYLADLECSSCGETMGHRAGCDRYRHQSTGRGTMHKDTAGFLLRNVSVPHSAIRFAAAMRSIQGDAFDALYFLEKPYKWAAEYALWSNLGEPGPNDLEALGELAADIADCQELTS